MADIILLRIPARATVSTKERAFDVFWVPSVITTSLCGSLPRPEILLARLLLYLFARPYSATLWLSGIRTIN